jgi:hypothetical protein
MHQVKGFHFYPLNIVRGLLIKGKLNKCKLKWGDGIHQWYNDSRPFYDDPNLASYTQDIAFKLE